LDYVQSFAKFGSVLQGRLLSNWKQVLADHFSEPVDLEVVLLAHDCSTAANFQCAIDLFLQHTLNKKKPCDCQWIYMYPGSNFGSARISDLLILPMDHLHWFKKMMGIMQMLPEEDIQIPNAALQVEWFYMSFHCSNHAEYLRSGRKLCDETLLTLAEYFKSVFNV
jgi:hypothetical protein